MSVPDHTPGATPAGEPSPAAEFAPPDGPRFAFAPPDGLPAAFPPLAGPPVTFPAPVGQPVTFPPPAGPPVAGGQPRAGRTRPGRLLLILALIAGLAGVGGGGTGLVIEFTRAPTRAEVTAAGQAEVASRWQRLPAGQLFPATVSYITTDAMTTSAVRVGIAPEASCAAALDPGILALFRRYGCRGVLRATYLDESGTVAGTVGVAIMRSPAAATAAADGVPPAAGIRVPAFPGTRAALFGNAQRDLGLAARAQGPYVFLFAGGSADGRPAADLPANASLDLGTGLVAREMSILTGGPRPCARKDVRC